jgi:hypothetical protein
MSGFITRQEVLNEQDFIRENWGEAFLQTCLMVTDDTTTFLDLLREEGKI